MNCLLHYFNYARRNNSVDNLLKLFKAVPDSNNFDLALLSDMLLSIYSKPYFLCISQNVCMSLTLMLIMFTFTDKTGDCNNAIELWKLMCAKNIKPSKQFKNNFIQFLQANKAPLPPEFEQDKNKINVSN